MKDLLQKYASEYTNTSRAAVGSFKEEDSLTAAGEEVEVVVVQPRALVYSEVQEEVALVTEETAMLEKPIFECLPLKEHQCGERFTTCSVSVACSYENTISLDSSMENVFPKIMIGEATGTIN